MPFAHFQEKSRRLPLYMCIHGVQQVCDQRVCDVYDIKDHNNKKWKKHMLCLDKLEHSVLRDTTYS
jgi:hypothetical protein